MHANLLLDLRIIDLVINLENEPSSYQTYAKP